MLFNYQARTKEGEIQSGTVEAPSRETAITLLQKNKLFVTFLEETAAEPFYARKIKFLQRVTGKELVIFSRQLSIMFQSKISLMEALRVLSSQTKNQAFREKILKISEEVEGGTPFSQALSRYSKLFSPFFVSMVRAGESSGTLSKSFDYLADHLERDYWFRSKIIGAMLYPVMVIFVAVAVIFLLTFYVFPSFSAFIKEMPNEPPKITKIVLGFTDFLRAWWWLVVSPFVGFVFLFFTFLRTASGKSFLDRAVLKIPLVGGVSKTIFLARFSENLATLISGGLPIARALEISGEIVGNEVYKKIIFTARDRVRRGETISSVLLKFPNAFPPVFVQIVLIGEKTGTLDNTLSNIAKFYERESERDMENVLGILGPGLIVFLGLMVGGLVAAVLMPIYGSMSSGL